MAYTKQNFINGQVLDATQLNMIEDGIVAAHNALEQKQPKGNYLTEVPDGYATEDFVENKIADLQTEVDELKESVGGSIDVFGSVVYIATDYGISTEADDNSPALQSLIDRLHAGGGGVIWFPVGTYRFRKSGADADGKEYAVVPKSNVSIIGESMVGTVLKQVDPFPYGMFTRRATADDPLFGCHFERFTVDAYETGDVNQVYGKAFHAKYVRNCVFRDLILKGTTATAMGVDFLDNVLIDHVYCLDCGRTWTGSEPGTSGIGIGTGGWENENFVISNCVTEGCGQFGIFIENQTNIFGYNGRAYSKGCIISNCVVRNGLHYGIGIRGGENVTVIGCETYENAGNGVYLDNKCKNVHIMSVSATNNGGHGIRINTDEDSSGIYIQGCNAVGNTNDGIRVSTSCDALTIQGCTTRSNAVGITIKDGLILSDCAIWSNVFMDGVDNAAQYSGCTDYIDVAFDKAQTRIELSGSDFTVGVKINPDGSEGTTGGGQASGYLDVSGISGNIKITTTGTADTMRVCQYDADKNSLVTDAAMEPSVAFTTEKLDGCVYIRIYYASISGSPATIESVVVEQG